MLLPACSRSQGAATGGQVETLWENAVSSHPAEF